MAGVFELFLELSITLFFLGMASLTAGWALLRRMNPRAAVLFGTLTVLLLTTTLFLLGVLDQKQDLWTLVRGYFDQNRFEEHWKVYSQSMGQTGIFPAGRLEAFKDAYQKYFYWSLPAWLAFRCLVEGLLAYYIASAVFSRVTSRVPKAVSFREWILPEPTVFGLIAASILKLTVPANGWADILSDNLLVFFLGLYSLAGLSIVSFFFDRWRLRPIFRFFCFCLVFIFAFDAVFCLGVLDVWFDFRKVKDPPELPIEPKDD